MAPRNHRPIGRAHYDPTEDYRDEADNIKLRRIDETDAQPMPLTIAETWHDQEYDKRRDEQPELFAGEGEQAARSASIRAKGLEVAANAARLRLNLQQKVMEQAGAWTVLAYELLTPYVRRKPRSKYWYTGTWFTLVGGDVAGIAGAAINYGEIVYLAIMQAAASGIAAVTAGVVGQDVRDMVLARRRATEVDELDERLKPFAHLFRVGVDAERIIKMVLGLAATVGLLIAGGVFALRSAVEGSTAGFVFGFLAIGLTLASFLNNYINADDVADAIDNADHNYKKELKRHAKLGKSTAIRAFAESNEEARSILAEYVARGQAAAHEFEALKFRIKANNPEVVGHGPAAQKLPIQYSLFDKSELSVNGKRAG